MPIFLSLSDTALRKFCKGDQKSLLSFFATQEFSASSVRVLCKDDMSSVLYSSSILISDLLFHNTLLSSINCARLVLPLVIITFFLLTT